MILQEIRLTMRLHRFELYAFGTALVVLVIAGFVGSAYVDGLRPGPECMAIDGSAPPSCEPGLRAWNAAQQMVGGLILSPTLAVAYVIGAFLGVPIVARELERGTTRLAWSLAPSRWRWFAVRALPVLAIIVVLTFVAGAAVDRFFAASVQGEDPAASFTLYGARGVLLAARAAFIFGVAVVVGAVVGRALPALIVTALIVTIGISGGEGVYQNVILRNEAIPVEMRFDENGQGNRGDLTFDTVYQLPDGSLVSWEYFGDNGPFDENGMPTYPMFSMVVPGSQYRFVEAREAVALAVATLVALLIAGVVVARRRPG
jgi:ABC-type transport system involved in multi-copper enzyme maturation permease subunit